MKQAEKQPQEYCRSVFKNKEKDDISRCFTELWTELINRMERSKEITCRPQK